MECLYKEVKDKMFPLYEPCEEIGSEVFEVRALKDEEFAQITVLGLCVFVPSEAREFTFESKAGKPRKTIVKDTLVQDNQKEVDQNEGAKKSQKNRYSSFTVTDCKAAVRFKAIHGTNCYKLYDFVENHNHPLIDENNLDNLRARRKLDFSDKVFIHRASLSNIGPTKAHRLRVAFMGGYHKAVNDELSRMFWADETMKCNYIAFGDVVSFDATYRTNRYRMIFICGDVENDSEFKKLFHKLIWNVHIGPEEFEQRWHALIGMFNLSANS
ncbi:FAR1-related sequence 5-like protein, partial [Tanacetum coccineum]